MNESLQWQERHEGRRAVHPPPVPQPAPGLAGRPEPGTRKSAFAVSSLSTSNTSRAENCIVRSRYSTSVLSRVENERKRWFSVSATIKKTSRVRAIGVPLVLHIGLAPPRENKKRQAYE